MESSDSKKAEPEEKSCGIFDVDLSTIYEKPVFTENATIQALLNLNIKPEDLIVTSDEDQNGDSYDFKVYVQMEKKRTELIKKIIKERQRILDSEANTHKKHPTEHKSKIPVLTKPKKKKAAKKAPSNQAVPETNRRKRLKRPNPPKPYIPLENDTTKLALIRERAQQRLKKQKEEQIRLEKIRLSKQKEMDKKRQREEKRIQKLQEKKQKIYENEMKKRYEFIYKKAESMDKKKDRLSELRKKLVVSRIPTPPVLVQSKAKNSVPKQGKSRIPVLRLR